MSLTIYYDGECPLCARYSTMLRLERHQDVSLVDLRQVPEVRQQLLEMGFDLDQGMVVDQDGLRFGGADAVHALALLSSGSDAFNRLNRAVLGNALAARLLYPLLRAGRWLLLLLLGKEFISDDNSGSYRQTIFAICFALFSVFHFCNYATAYGRFPPGWDQLLLLAAAIFTFFKPGSSRVLLLLMAASLVSAVIQAPAQSNHTITRNFLLLGYWLSFTLAMLRNRPSREIFGNFVMAGQAVLLVMYFYGIFHKINTDFLNPVTSCAVALWERMPAPLSMIDGWVVDHATIYGTFVVEGAIALMLLIRRWRHLGIAAGMAFHLLLAMSSYAMYIAFTVLTIAMHSLFLSEDAARRIMESQPMALVRSRLQRPIYLVLGIVFLLLLGTLAFRGSYGLASMMAMPLVLPYCWVILRYGKAEEAAPMRSTGALAVGAITFAAFLANGAMPYLGLKTAQSLNMFANLRLEQGVSNHLVFSNPPGPFRYLEDVAIVEGQTGDFDMQNSIESGFGVVYYDVLAFLADNPDEPLSFTINGRSYRNVSAADMREEIDATLHPAWFRKWFHFQPVQLDRPERCTI